MHWALKRTFTVPVSLATAVLFIMLLTRLLPESAAVILLDLGRGSWPFTVQNVMWLVFFVGLSELAVRWHAGWLEDEQVGRHYLPEDDETVLRAGKDLAPVYQRVRNDPQARACFLPRLISRCILGFNLGNSVDQTNALLNSSLDMFAHEIDLRYHIVRYTTWLVPSLGFIGTVVGIMLALNYAGNMENVERPDLLFQVTERLGVAFATTLVGLVMSAILVFLQNVIQAREERALNAAGQYCLDNLINRLYSP